MEAQLGIRKPGVIIDEKFENVSEVHHISREAEFDLKVPEDGEYIFQLLGGKGTIHLKAFSKP